MAIRRRGSGWQADITVKGKRYREAFTTQADAQAWELEARAAVLQGKEVPTPTRTPDAPEEPARRTRKPSGGTLGAALQDCYNRFWRGGKSDAKMAINMKQVESYFGRDRPLEEVDSAAIETFIAHCITQRNSNGTVNRKLSVLGKALGYAALRGLIPSKPKMSRLPEKGGRFRWLTTDEEQELLATLRRFGRDEQADCVAILIDTGLRPSELFRLQADDVDMQRGTLTIWVTKTDRPRTLFMTKRVKALLQPRLERSGPLFPYDTAWLYRAWQDAKTALGKTADPHYVPYICRHTCASRLIQRGVQLNIVKEWLGHSTITTTMRYAHLAPDNLKSAVDALEA